MSSAACVNRGSALPPTSRRQCKIRGHEKSECRKLKKEQEEAKEAKAKSAETTKSKSADASAKIAVAEEEPDSNSDPVRLFRVSQDFPVRGDLRHQWIVDSGASRTMCSNRAWFTQFTTLTSPVNIVLGDNSSILGTGTGRIAVQMLAGGKWVRAVLQDVLYVPELHGNLLSVSQLARRGADVRFAKGGCQIYDQNGTLTCEGTLRGNLYLMPIRTEPSESARVAVAQLDSFPTKGDNLPSFAGIGVLATSTLTPS